jgi:hypothetical protein
MSHFYEHRDIYGRYIINKKHHHMLFFFSPCVFFAACRLGLSVSYLCSAPHSLESLQHSEKCIEVEHLHLFQCECISLPKDQVNLMLLKKTFWAASLLTRSRHG